MLVAPMHENRLLTLGHRGSMIHDDTVFPYTSLVFISCSSTRGWITHIRTPWVTGCTSAVSQVLSLYLEEEEEEEEEAEAEAEEKKVQEENLKKRARHGW